MATDPQTATTGSGTWGGATIEDIRNITVEREKVEKAYASSSTAGLIKRKTGHKDARGTFDVYLPATPAGPADILPFNEGDEAALVLKSSTGQTLFNGTAVVTNLSHGVPVEGGDLVATTVTWGQA